MDGDEKERRKLIFQNLSNGVSIADVMSALKMSEKEVMDDFRFVAKKVVSYRFERAMPYQPCGTVQEAIQGRVQFLHTLDRLNLGTDPKFGNVQVVAAEDSMAKLMEMQQRRMQGDGKSTAT